MDTPVSLSAKSVSSKRVGLMDLLVILLRRKIFILVGLCVISIAAVITTLLMTKEYVAVAVVLPSTSSSSALGSLLGDMPGGGLLGGGLFSKDDNSKFLTILQSRVMAEAVINKFGLVKRYGFLKRKQYYIEDVIKEYYRHSGSEEDKLNNIDVVFRDSNPEFSANVANFMVAKLDTLSYEMTRQNARGSRIFFENRLKEMRGVLDSVHSRLAEFQIKNNMIDMDAQVKSTVEALADIEAQIIGNEITRSVMSSNFTSDNQSIADLDKRKAVLKNHLEEYMNKGSGNLILPLKKTPELGITYAYLLRDVKTQEALNSFLLQMYEQAKFREANNASVVTVLQWAAPPQKRSSPARMHICILAFFSGFCLLSIIVVLQHWLQKQREALTETFLKLKEIKALLLSWR